MAWRERIPHLHEDREGARPDDPPWLLLRADQVIDVAERCNGADGRHVLLYHREIQPFDRDGRYLRSLTATE